MSIVSREADLRLNIDALPIAQPRPRAILLGDPCGVQSVRIISASSSHPVGKYKRAIKAVVSMAVAAPCSEAVAVRLLFRMPRPKSKVWKRREMLRELHAGKPDLDNLAKSVLDACNGVLWLDDGQISQLELVKVVAAGDERPGVEIELWRS